MLNSTRNATLPTSNVSNSTNKTNGTNSTNKTNTTNGTNRTNGTNGTNVTNGTVPLPIYATNKTLLNESQLYISNWTPGYAPTPAEAIVGGAALNTLTTAPPQQPSPSLAVGQILGIVVGGLAAVCLVALLVAFGVRRRKPRKYAPQPPPAREDIAVTGGLVMSSAKQSQIHPADMLSPISLGKIAQAGAVSAATMSQQQRRASRTATQRKNPPGVMPVHPSKMAAASTRSSDTATLGSGRVAAAAAIGVAGDAVLRRHGSSGSTGPPPAHPPPGPPSNTSSPGPANVRVMSLYEPTPMMLTDEGVVELQAQDSAPVAHTAGGKSNNYVLPKPKTGDGFGISIPVVSGGAPPSTSYAPVAQAGTAGGFSVPIVNRSRSKLPSSQSEDYDDLTDDELSDDY